MANNNYDIFISYRRTAYDTANLIAVKLRHAGYKVFFDVDTLTAGKFNEQLLEVIRNCKDFILVLPEDALDRCHQPEDWIRRETVCAMENHKNIIPVMLDGFSWPAKMPEGMEELPHYQAVTAVGHEYFDMAMQRLQGYLKCKPTKPIGKWLTKAAFALGVIIVLLFIGGGVVRHIANVTCRTIGVQQTSSMNVIEMLGEDCNDLNEEMLSFFKLIDKAKNAEERSEAEHDILKVVEKTEKQTSYYRKTIPDPSFNFNSIENYVLAYYNIHQEELDAFSMFYASVFDDMEELCQTVREIIDTHRYSQLERDRFATDVSCFGYSLNAYYYGYIGCLSLLPKTARKEHFEMAKKWKCFPNGVPFDLAQEEYEQFQMLEIAHYEEAAERFHATVNYEERKLNEIEERLDVLEDQATQFENFQ